MLKYAKIIDEKTKQVSVGAGTNSKFYESIGMTMMEVEEAYNHLWYIKGYAPEPTKEEIAQTRRQLYIEQKDPITCQIQALKDEEQTEEIITEIEALKIERTKIVEKIKEENPYPIEPTETKASEVVDDSVLTNE